MERQNSGQLMAKKIKRGQAGFVMRRRKGKMILADMTRRRSERVLRQELLQEEPVEDSTTDTSEDAYGCCAEGSSETPQRHEMGAETGNDTTAASASPNASDEAEEEAEEVEEADEAEGSDAGTQGDDDDDGEPSDPSDAPGGLAGASAAGASSDTPTAAAPSYLHHVKQWMSIQATHRCSLAAAGEFFQYMINNIEDIRIACSEEETIQYTHARRAVIARELPPVTVHTTFADVEDGEEHKFTGPSFERKKYRDRSQYILQHEAYSVEVTFRLCC